ncbi:hypothetical protein HN51_057288 [Arachis hypogaea]|uniref:Myb-like domain-containing protein n=1 Tax=Arachis hypogaea TaxID=3818 RepID=A0A444WWN0_ARAHY|nr:uncharacterized protein LOC112785706 [Arachis hypogaea]QHN80234.1 AT-rich interactive domain-containing protein [Arachis hypogaea]RYQ81810.1 hypothetical protein Ahy_B10g100407 [Arachis hypogaea]
MVQKRPFDAEEMLEVSFKHPKHAEPSDQLVSFSESVFPDDDCHTHMPQTSEGGCGQGSNEGIEKLAGESIGKGPRGAEDSEASFPVAWATSSTTEQVVKSESPVHLALFPEYFHSEPSVHVALFPEYFSPEKPFRTLARYEDIYSILIENPPRKLVSMGANHQADIPVWDSSVAIDRPNASEDVSNLGFPIGDEDEKRLMGTCIIPMPQMELSSDNDDVGKGRTNCWCEDRGSIRCVRQHIAEERERLLKEFGHEKFDELGFNDMGERVAEKWSAEEERLFHEVVFNNPVSLGKNFWHYLSIALPSRSKKEIVSYYFNVFMLRKRAEQNRNDALSIDSDNDEWQGSDGIDIATREEDEDDSVVDSPVDQNDIGFTSCHENDQVDYDDEFAADEICAVNGTVDLTERNIDDEDDSKYDAVSVGRSTVTNRFCPPIQPHDQTIHKDDENVKDETCTFSDAVVSSQETRAKSGAEGDQWCGNYNEVASNGYSNGHVLEPCDAKVWDPAFLSCSKSKIDFLPTCNMIEEIFGDGRRQDMRKG